MKDELRLAKQLYARDAAGVIGGETARREHRLTTLPASSIYWSALIRWGVLQGGDDAPSKRDVFRSWQHWATRANDDAHLTDDEAGFLARRRPLLSGLPDAPNGWSNTGTPVDFSLRAAERADLRSRPGATRRSDGQPSLLAQLVRERFVPEGEARHAPWHASVLKRSIGTSMRGLGRQ